MTIQNAKVTDAATTTVHWFLATSQMHFNIHKLVSTNLGNEHTHTHVQTC